MKNTFLALLVFFPLASFASDRGFDVMAIQEIYSRGYMIEATVTVDKGIRFQKGYDTQNIGDCRIKLHKTVSTDSILKNGRKIKLFKTGLGKFSSHSFYRELYTKQDRSVLGLAYMPDLWSADKSSVTLAKLKELCDEAFRFNVVENTFLDEL